MIRTYDVYLEKQRIGTIQLNGPKAYWEYTFDGETVGNFSSPDSCLEEIRQKSAAQCKHLIHMRAAH